MPRGPARRCGCSTPCGIIGPFTPRSDAPVKSLTCAQRLAASLVLSRLVGHHPLCRVCSTPCGIIGPFTGRVLDEASLAPQCSTPCGIIGPFTTIGCARTLCAQRLAASLVLSRPADISARQGGAQRLAASLVLSRSRHLDRPLTSRALCSTPCGIIGPFTRRPAAYGSGGIGRAQRLAASLVLSLVPFEAGELDVGAQRLAASLVLSRKPIGSDVLAPAGAQRLAASLVLSPLHLAGIAANRVLNALRHHWSFHCRSSSMEFVKSVLNALRHHWSFHHVASLTIGVTAVDVLNALRHHWSFHGDLRHIPAACDRCSTPCGIIGPFTAIGRRDRRARAGAQRLAASLVLSRMHAQVGIRRVLNALRHHWSFHGSASAAAMRALCILCSTPCGIIGPFTSGNRRPRRAHRSAQRLAASLVLSRHGRGNANPNVLDECSTPCGIIGPFTVRLGS